MRSAVATMIALLAAPVGGMQASPARAASFACVGSVAADEVAVCGTPVLSDLDVKLATLYGAVLKLVAMGVRADLEDQQRAFLKARATCGGDTACIATLYDQRIASLEKVLDDIAARGPY